MSCQWEHYDCKNSETKCHLCFVKDQFYVSTTKVKMPKKAVPSKRKGAIFEANNSNLNNEILLGRSANTPNSGAGQIKGDERIMGLIEIMEELKEDNGTTSKGQKTFTMHKAWLEKLEKEAKKENKEFYYLKFCFGTEDAKQNKYYVAIDGMQLMSMVKTIWEDRKVAKLAQSKIDVSEKRSRLYEVENAKLRAEIDLLKAEIAQMKAEKEIQNG